MAQASTHASGADLKVIQQDLLHRRAKAKETYDRRSSSPSDSLVLGERAYAKLPLVRKGEPWEFGTIVDLPGPNSYVIKTSGGKMVRRNRRDIARARASPPPKTDIIEAREPQMVPSLLERSNGPETMMGDAQSWPACPSEDPKDVPPEPENSPPSDARMSGRRTEGCPFGASADSTR